MEDERRARVRAGAVIGLGLLLALAATAGPLPLASAEPGASLSVRLPDAVRAIALGLLALSAVLLLAMQRPRRPAGADPLAARGYQRRSAWTAVLSLLPFLLLLAVAWYLVRNPGADDARHPFDQAITAIAGLLDFLAQVRKAPTSVPAFDYTIAALVLALAVGVFALVVMVTLAERLEKWFGRRAGAPAAPPALDGPRDLDDPRAEPDARRAIIAAYRRFERALATARAPRAPWQTPAEFMRATLDRLPVPAPPVERLTALFELARFSRRPLGAETREAACECLDEVTAALPEAARRAR